MRTQVYTEWCTYDDNCTEIMNTQLIYVGLAQARLSEYVLEDYDLETSILCGHHFCYFW